MLQTCSDHGRNHIMWLLERFFEQFGELTSFLTDEDIVTICNRLTEPKPNIKKLIGLIWRDLNAGADKSRENLRVCCQPLCCSHDVAANTTRVAMRGRVQASRNEGPSGVDGAQHDSTGQISC